MTEGLFLSVAFTAEQTTKLSGLNSNHLLSLGFNGFALWAGLSWWFFCWSRWGSLTCLFSCHSAGQLCFGHLLSVG